MLLVVAALVLVPFAVWAVGFGMGMAEKTAHLSDYLRGVVLLPGPFLVTGALLVLASRRAFRRL